MDADLLQPVRSDAFDRYRENALRKLVSVSVLVLPLIFYSKNKTKQLNSYYFLFTVK